MVWPGITARPVCSALAELMAGCSDAAGALRTIPSEARCALVTSSKKLPLGVGDVDVAAQATRGVARPMAAE